MPRLGETVLRSIEGDCVTVLDDKDVLMVEIE